MSMATTIPTTLGGTSRSISCCDEFVVTVLSTLSTQGILLLWTDPCLFAGIMFNPFNPHGTRYRSDH